MTNDDTNSSEDTNKQETPSSGELAVDVFENDTEILIIAPIAGITSEQLNILVENDLLSIKGTRTPPERITKMKTYASECFWGGFERTIALPTAVNSEDISAEFQSNILYITVPKARKASKKVVSIH